MIGMVASLIAAVWLYQSAKENGKSKLLWAIIGFFVFNLPGFLLNLLYEKLIWRPTVNLDYLRFNDLVPPTIPRIILIVLGIILGTLSVYLINREFLKTVPIKNE